jgi:starch phosphorylase
MSTQPPPSLADTRTGTSVESLRRAMLDALYYTQAKFPAVATRNDCYMALAHAVRDRLLQKWVSTAETYYRRAARTVCYLSAEYLLGPHLGNNLLNLGLVEQAREAVAAVGRTLEELLDQEEEPGLGNGGLGRLAACYQDSLATLGIPTIGYGIRYEFGIFDQVIRDGWQVEVTDKWLRFGNPWEIARPEIALPVGFGGYTRNFTDNDGRYRVVWMPERVVLGVAYDTPILGYRVGTANLLRLWQAQAVESFDFQAFNVGDYLRAVDEKVTSENISKVLYPNDSSDQGKALRLQQQYFFVACSLKDMIRIFGQRASDLARLPEKYAVQLNDTHPAVAVAELMRLLVDEHQMEWDQAWDVTRRAFSTRTTRCCPRRSKRGRWTCSAACCRGTWRSSSKSTAAGWRRCGWRSPATRGRRSASRSSTSAAGAASAWPTSPPSAATPSTGCRRCTAGSSASRC